MNLPCLKPPALFLLFLFAFQFGGKAVYGNTIDSLKTLAAVEKTSENKILLLREISVAAAEQNIKVALKEADAYYNYARQIKNNNAIVQALILKGKIYIEHQQYDSAMNCSENALVIAGGLKDSSQIANLYNQKGDIFKARNEISKALEFYNKSYTINLQIKNNKGQFENLNRIATIYFGQNRFDDAYKMDREAFELAVKTGDEELLAIANGSMGNIHYMKHSLDSALSYYLKSLTYYERTSGLKLAVVYANIGDVYADKKNFEKALAYFNKALPVAEKIANENVLSHLYIAIGRCYQLNKNYDKALPFFQKGETLATVAVNYELLAEVYGLTADLYAAKNDFSKAFEYQLKVENAKDSLNRLNSDNKVLELQTRFETLKHDKENAILKVENEMAKTRVERQRFSIIILSAAIILIGLLIYRMFRFRSKKLRTEQALNSQLELQNLNIARLNNMLEIRAIRAQMDPHFIFNCLASLLHLITTQKTEEAEKYIVKFSRLLRMVLDNAEQNTVSLDKELELLKLYLDLESIRMNENFKYEINVDESLLDENIKVPTLIIQPFAENAIRHGLAGKKENRVLLINIEANNNVLKCIIEDNGIGRKLSAEKNNTKGHESKAIKMINERLKIIKQQTKIKETGIETIDLFDEQQQPAGTKVIIQIPMIIRA